MFRFDRVCLIPVVPLLLVGLGACSDPVSLIESNVCDGVQQPDEETVDAPFDMDGDGWFDGRNQDCVETYGGDGVDCDDTNAAIYPTAEEVACDGLDNDCDGETPDETDEDEDGYGSCTDCDDTNAAIYPGADDICDELDNDCDGETDEDGELSWYGDADGDGWGVATLTVIGCTPPPGYVAQAGDCNEGDAAIHPTAPERCNGIDDDCDGLLPGDEGDTDGDGYAPCDGDCDDTTAEVSPGATERCNERDDDCDGLVDEDLDVPFYADSDGDGWGASGSSVTACSPPAGFVPDGGDCDDGDPLVSPGATEACNGIDDDCDGALAPEEIDSDGDGTSSCEGDCDDTNSSIGPDRPEVCNGVDDDCDGLLPLDEQDADTDGFAACEGDCDDGNPTINPTAEETCNGIDDDCDGETDEGVGTTYYADIDGDGWGSESSAVTACAPDEGFVESPGDCDEGDPLIHPGALERCNGLDDDCNGSLPAEEQDLDGDGFSACAGDCDDGVSTTGPGFEELCNGTDDDCDGIVPPEEVDGDGDGTSDCDGDCDDGDPLTFPDAVERCNGIDDNCDGSIPAEEADGDGDDYRICEGDCDDDDPFVSPGAVEVCNGIDDDCDGLLAPDEADADGDGVGICEGDCDDTAAATYPGAPEVCDGLDNDCDGTIPAEELDEDGDGLSACEGDCDDLSPEIGLLAPEICDTIDNDCDGLIDDEDADAIGSPSSVLVFEDYSTTPATGPGAAAGDALGAIVVSTGDQSEFVDEFASQPWTVVIVNGPPVVPSTAFTEVLRTQLEAGRSLLFASGFVDELPTIAELLQVTPTSDLFDPPDVYPAEDSPRDLWNLDERIAAPFASSSDAVANGNNLLPAEADGWVAGRFGSPDGAAGVIVTHEGRAVVSGFVPLDFAGSDVDGDGRDDMIEFFTNQLRLVTSCQTCIDDAFEPNDSAVEAYFSERETDLLLSGDSPVDVWSIEVPSFSALEIDVSFLHSEGDIDIELTDALSTSLAISESVTDNENLSWTNRSGVSTIVYLRVELAAFPSDEYCQLYEFSSALREGCVLLEDFEVSSWPSAPWVDISGGSVGSPAHDGSFSYSGGWSWQDADVVGLPGDLLSAWFYSGTGGRAYLGFDAGSDGGKSFVMAPNTDDIRFQENVAYGYRELTTSAQTFSDNSWYRGEVEFLGGGSVIGRLYASDGVTLLNTVSETYPTLSARGLALRTFGGLRVDTIELCAGTWSP